MEKIKIYHNTRCSKSRQTLELLKSRGVEPEVVLYMEQPIDRKTLRELLQKLGITARELLRSNEEACKKRGLHRPQTSEAEIIAAMVGEPRLIQRPIVVRGARAVLGRPPENVLQLL